MVMRGFTDGVNNELVSALKRAWCCGGRRFDARGERWVRGAIERIERNVSTPDRELKKAQLRLRVW